jgi:AcrR family transcriptional regulator
MAAAFAQVETGGLASVTMRGVAGEVGLSPMGVYRHFESRDAIIDALVDEGVARYEYRLAQVPRASSALERLRGIMRAYMVFALEEPTHFYIVFLSYRPNGTQAVDDYRAGTSPSFEILHEAVADAISAGALARRNTLDVAQTLLAHGHGLAALHLTGRFGGSESAFRRFFASSMDVLLVGLSRG